MEKIVDYIPPVLGFLLIIISVRKAVNEGWNNLALAELIVGVLIAGSSAVSIKLNSSSSKRLQSSIDTLLNNRKVDSVNNEKFKTFLKDSFGIEKRDTTAVISNTYIYNSKSIDTIKKVLDTVKTNTTIPDSLNFSIKILGDSLFLAPKYGAWEKGFVGFDMQNWEAIQKLNILSEGIAPGNDFPVSIINNKKYRIGIFSIYERAINPRMPIKLNLTGYKNQFLIFGDQVSETKRYLFQNGKVRWFPGY